MNISRSFSTVVVSIILVGCAAGFRAGGWERLGTLQVGPGNDHDMLSVERQVGSLSELRLEVRGGPIEMSDMVVTFADGSTFKPNFRTQFDERSRSEEMDLPGNRRTIRQIDFTYSTRQSGVSLEVYGR
jgi:hypothetical protein